MAGVQLQCNSPINWSDLLPQLQLRAAQAGTLLAAGHAGRTEMKEQRGVKMYPEFGKKFFDVVRGGFRT